MRNDWELMQRMGTAISAPSPGPARGTGRPMELSLAPHSPHFQPHPGNQHLATRPTVCSDRNPVWSGNHASPHEVSHTYYAHGVADVDEGTFKVISVIQFGSRADAPTHIRDFYIQRCVATLEGRKPH